jgi:hypothetical protein
MTRADHREGEERDYCQYFLFSVHRRRAVWPSLICSLILRSFSLYAGEQIHIIPCGIKTKSRFHKQASAV